MQLRFGEMTLDLDARQIVGPSGEVHLSPKAFELLKVVIENRPRAVSKMELQERLWPDTFVVEGNVANLIAEVREALGDDARRSRFIRTVQRFGYAFAAAVDEIGPAPPSAGAAIYWLCWDERPLPLTKGENLVGRDAQAHVRLDAVTVSRRHARIVVGGNGDALIEDLGSTNGTFVSGERLLAPRQLVAGERIEFGSCAVTFRASLSDGPTQPL